MSDTKELELRHIDSEAKGGFYLHDADGTKLGEMTYTRRSPGILAFDHTWVDSSLRGQGQAGVLLDAAMTWVRARGDKVIPVCSYVVKKFDEDEQLAALRAPSA